MSYKALGVRFVAGTTRDTLDAGQLNRLADIESKQAEYLTECMAKGTQYKKIYKDVGNNILKRFNPSSR